MVGGIFHATRRTKDMAGGRPSIAGGRHTGFLVSWVSDGRATWVKMQEYALHLIERHARAKVMAESGRGSIKKRALLLMQQERPKPLSTQGAKSVEELLQQLSQHPDVTVSIQTGIPDWYTGEILLSI